MSPTIGTVNESCGFVQMPGQLQEDLRNELDDIS